MSLFRKSTPGGIGARAHQRKLRQGVAPKASAAVSLKQHREHRNDAVCYQWQQGRDTASIAKDFALTKGHVSRILTQRGLMERQLSNGSIEGRKVTGKVDDSPIGLDDNRRRALAEAANHQFLIRLFRYGKTHGLPKIAPDECRAELYRLEGRI